MRSVFKRALLAGVPPLFALLALVASGFAAAAAPAAAQSEREMCRGCHTPYVETFEASIHGKRGHPRAPANAGDCSSCNGAGVIDHAKKGGGKAHAGMRTFTKKTAAEDRSNVCQTCHASNRHLAFWESGMHRKNDVACNDCHKLHGTPGKGATVALVTPNPNVSTRSAAVASRTPAASAAVKAAATPAKSSTQFIRGDDDDDSRPGNKLSRAERKRIRKQQRGDRYDDE